MMVLRPKRMIHGKLGKLQPAALFMAQPHAGNNETEIIGHPKVATADQFERLLFRNWPASAVGRAPFEGRLALICQFRLLPGLHDRQHFFRKELQGSFRNMERRATEAEGDVPLEIAEQSATFFKAT